MAVRPGRPSSCPSGGGPAAPGGPWPEGLLLLHEQSASDGGKTLDQPQLTLASGRVTLMTGRKIGAIMFGNMQSSLTLSE